MYEYVQLHVSKPFAQQFACMLCLFHVLILLSAWNMFARVCCSCLTDKQQGLEPSWCTVLPAESVLAPSTHDTPHTYIVHACHCTVFACPFSLMDISNTHATVAVRSSCSIIYIIHIYIIFDNNNSNNNNAL